MDSIRDQFDSARRTLREDGTLRTVLKNTGWLTGSSGMLIVLSAVQGILTARLLGVAVYGMLGLATAFCVVMGKLLSFRMSDFVVKWVTQLIEDGTAKAATAFKLAIAADAASALVACLAAEALASWGASVFAHNPDFAWVFRWLALTVALQAGRESFTGMLQVNRDFRALSTLQAGCQAASLGCVTVVFLAGWGLAGIVAVYVGVEALTTLLTWAIGLRAAHVVLPRGWIRSRLERLGDAGREMGHFVLMTNMGATLKLTQDQGDLLLLGFLRNPAEAALYKLAKNIMQIVYLPMMPLVNASYPEFSRAAARRKWGEFRSLMRRGTKLSALWFVPACIGAVALAPLAIGTLYGRAFLPAVPALAVLLVGVAVDGVLFWTTIALLSMGEPGYLTRVGLEGAILKFGLALVLVPRGGVVAMALAATAAMTAMNILIARRVYAGIRARESAAL